jgi:hypothetical protein
VHGGQGGRVHVDPSLERAHTKHKPLFGGVMGQEAEEGWERRQTELLSKHSVLGSRGRAGPTGWPSRL